MFFKNFLCRNNFKIIFILTVFWVTALFSGVYAVPPEIDPNGLFHLSDSCIFVDSQSNLEVIDADGGTINVTANIGNPVMTNFYIDGENVSHWQGHIAFDMNELCGATYEGDLEITAIDDQAEADTAAFGPIAIVGSMAASMDDSLYIWPGYEEWMPIYLDVADCFCTGGFVFTIIYDASILSITDVMIGDAFSGHEDDFSFFYDPYGPGTIKVLFNVDIGEEGVCDINPLDPIFRLKFYLEPGEYPIDFTVPVCFHDPEPYYTYNGVTDKSGYGLWYSDGCSGGGLQLELQCGNIRAVNEPNFILGDLNLNGFPFEMGDLVLAINAILDPVACPLSPRQRLAGDIDQDGIPVTFADILYLMYNIFEGPEPWEQVYPQTPESDTLSVESAVVTPGQISLPVYLKTVDTLMDFQAYIVSDINYITLDSLVLSDTTWLTQSTVSGFPHVFSYGNDINLPDSSTLIYPGVYHIGDLIGHVRPDIQTPATTTIGFQDNPEYLAYIGLANQSFFQPVTVGTEIVIMADSSNEYLPGDVNMHLGLWPPQVIGSDVTYLVNYFRGIESSQPCLIDGFWVSTDINGDCSIIGSDVTRLVNYFRGTGTINFCPNFVPNWLNVDSLPEEPPDGWPNCE